MPSLVKKLSAEERYGQVSKKRQAGPSSIAGIHKQVSQPSKSFPTKQSRSHPEQLPHFAWHQFALPQKSLPVPQKLLPLQHNPLAHFAFTIGPHVSPFCAVFAGAVGKGGGERLVAQSPKPGWQPAAGPQYMDWSWSWVGGVMLDGCLFPWEGKGFSDWGGESTSFLGPQCP